MELVEITIMNRNCIGHTLRKEKTDITRESLEFNINGKR